MSRRAAVLGLALAAAAACHDARPDAARVARAVRAYRAANGGEERTRLEDLRRVACGEGAPCDVKEACLASAEATVRALELKRRVAARLGEVKAGRLAADSPEATALAGDLDEAERLLAEGKQRLATCDDLLVDLERKNRL